MKLRKHAKQELDILGWSHSDYKDLLNLLDSLEKQSHSVQELPFFLGVFAKLAQFEPLAPLQGTKEEWMNVDLETLQNKRCFHVFKNIKTGQAYDARGCVFRKPNGACYVDKRSHVKIVFPYTPKTKYIDVLK